MTFEILTALAAFAFVTSITPGPNNLMLMASGANFGVRRTVPHALGVALGFVAMAIMIGLGMAQIFERWPLLHDILKWLSVGYILWLAHKIATAAAPADAQRAQGVPMTFLQAAAFQWVNPKAWAMALSAITVYAPEGSILQIALVAIIFGTVNLPSVSTWVLLGVQMKRLLTNPRRLQSFNIAMAILLIASLWPVLI